MASPSLSLDWKGDLKFSSSAGSPAIELDSSAEGVASPMHALAYGLMACMAMDVVHILQKGRHDLKDLKVHFDGERAAEHPRRYTAVHLRFELTGNVPDEAVTRAIELSHDKYCSVSNSIRTDIAFTTAFSVTRQ
jgi:putative redox protein